MDLLRLFLLSAVLAVNAHAATYERPAGAYTAQTFTGNATKYQDDSQAVPRRAISSAKVDGDINKAYDGLNQLDTRMTAIEVSGVPAGNKGAVTVSGSTWSLNAGVVSRTNLAAEVSTTLVPTGSVMMFAGSTAPSGWVLGFGQSVSRTGMYAGLFAVTGTTYGSTDANSFNVLDCRGRVLAGLDNQGGSAANRLTLAVSGISGTILGSAGGDQRMQAHTHTANVTDPGHAHGLGGNTGSPGNSPVFTNPGPAGTTGTTNSAVTGITVSNSTAGAGTAENIQPTLVLSCLVKL